MTRPPSPGASRTPGLCVSASLASALASPSVSLSHSHVYAPQLTVTPQRSGQPHIRHFTETDPITSHSDSHAASHMHSSAFQQASHHIPHPISALSVSQRTLTHALCVHLIHTAAYSHQTYSRQCHPVQLLPDQHHRNTAWVWHAKASPSYPTGVFAQVS